MDNNIASIRKARGWTQKEVCEALGWKLRRLQSYEQGQRNISAIEAVRLADLLCTTVYDLIIKEEA